jgi:hypothetical protein
MNAHACYIYVRGEFIREREHLQAAIDQAYEAKLVGKDTYEDLTKESFGKVLDGFASGNPPKPGPQNGRQFSAPMGGPTTLKEST